MTLTRAKMLHAGIWGVLVVLLLFAKEYGPIKIQPWKGIVIAAGVVLLISLILLIAGVGVEKPDERAHANAYKANSLLLNLIEIALLLYIIFSNEIPLIIPYEYVLVIAGLINIIQDVAFLYYERREA